MKKLALWMLGLTVTATVNAGSAPTFGGGSGVSGSAYISASGSADFMDLTTEVTGHIAQADLLAIRTGSALFTLSAEDANSLAKKILSLPDSSGSLAAGFASVSLTLSDGSPGSIYVDVASGQVTVRKV